METARRASVSAWNGFIDCAFTRLILALFRNSSCHAPTAFFLTAHFSQEDYPYDWCVTSAAAFVVPGPRCHCARH